MINKLRFLVFIGLIGLGFGAYLYLKNNIRFSELTLGLSTPSLIKRQLVLDQKSTVEQIQTVIQWVHQNTRPVEGHFDNMLPHTALRKFLDHQANTFQCGGMAALTAFVLEQVQIPARILQLGTERFFLGVARNETHVAVEAYVSEFKKWIVVDPTFNMIPKCSNSDQPAGYQQLRQCIERGFKVAAWWQGDTSDQRRMAAYYLPYEKLLFGTTAFRMDEYDNLFSWALRKAKYLPPLRTRVPIYEYPSVGWLDAVLNKYQLQETHRPD